MWYGCGQGCDGKSTKFVEKACAEEAGSWAKDGIVLLVGGGERLPLHHLFFSIY